jgi:hypothetical protein
MPFDKRVCLSILYYLSDIIGANMLYKLVDKKQHSGITVTAPTFFEDIKAWISHSGPGSSAGANHSI